jgi:uncharacterized protein (DUF486 family)
MSRCGTCEDDEETKGEGFAWYLAAMLTVLLLFVSNTFLTVAWYGHLKHRSAPFLTAIVVSWLIAFGEYCFQVPANRIGYGEWLLAVADKRSLA